MKELIQNALQGFTKEKLPSSLMIELEKEVKPKVQELVNQLVTPKLVSTTMRAQWEGRQNKKQPEKSDSGSVKPAA